MMHVPSSARTGVLVYNSARVGTSILGVVRRSSTVFVPARMASANLGLRDSEVPKWRWCSDWLGW